MKINYKNTALGFLDGSIPIKFLISEPNKEMTEFEKIDFGESIKKTLKENGSLFSKNVKYISESFYNAFNKGKNKLADVFDKEPIEEAGTFIYTFGSTTTTIFYALKTKDESSLWAYDIIILLFSKHTKSENQHLDLCVLEKDDRQRHFYWKGYEEKITTKYDIPRWWCSWIIAFLTFIKYCEIETKIIEGNKKGNHAGVKYLNETKQKIEILDSSWFTTIIRSEGFTVGADTGGFFRMQSYGPGMTKKKLIWVLPFEKKGYTRIAKVENLRNGNID